MKSVSASHGEWDDPPEKSHLQLKDTSWQVLAQTKPAGQKINLENLPSLKLT